MIRQNTNNEQELSSFRVKTLWKVFIPAKRKREFPLRYQLFKNGILAKDRLFKN